MVTIPKTLPLLQHICTSADGQFYKTFNNMAEKCFLLKPYGNLVLVQKAMLGHQHVEVK